jgi:putative proteasome-type protease
VSSAKATLREVARVTYCVGVKVDEGMVFASDSRTNAGLDNIAKFCKMTVFERTGDRVLVLLSSGNLAGTQAIISLLTQRGHDPDNSGSLWNARTMLDAANLVSDAMRDIERRDGPSLEASEVTFNASFILGGQIRGDEMRLFRIYAEGNFIESSDLTPYIQTGETKYGKPIIDRVITSSTNLSDVAKCVLVSFDSTMRSNISVGMPIDLICYELDSLQIRMRRRFDDGDPYFTSLHRSWSEGTRRVFSELPELVW